MRIMSEEIKSDDFKEDNGYEPKSENKLNKKKFMLIGFGACILLIIIMFISEILSTKIKKISSPKEQIKEEVNTSTRKIIAKDVGYAGEKATLLIQNNSNQKEAKSMSENTIEKEQLKPLQPILDETLNTYYEQLLQEELSARKSVIQFDDTSNNNAPNSDILPNIASNSGSRINGLGGANFQQETDQNKIKEKKEFLQGINENSTEVYNPYTLISPISKYQVNAGSIIPGIFITGVKSTLPGQMIGQVREDVYDSVTGNYVLIPKGAKLLGVYDSNVTFGQDRVMIIWERIIFPSGKSIQLNRFVGTDLSGYAGVTGKVNNHYAKLLTSVVLSSLIGAGTAIVTNNDNDKNNDWKYAAGQGAGEQIINIGNKFAERVINIAPEITIAPGQKFNIIVSSDMVLEPVK